jgi:hypothetical protein
VTGAQFGEVDLDLLADYAAGVLDETDSRHVRELIESDPRWTQAHDAVLAADAAVAAQLRAVAQVDLTIPDDVAARLDATLDEAHGTDSADAPVLSLVGQDRGIGRTRSHRPSQPTRRTVPWPWLAAAAAVIGVVLVGLPALGGLFTKMDGSPTSASDSGSGGFAASRENGQEAAPVAPRGAQDSAAGGAVVTFSGIDYTASSLKALSAVRGPLTDTGSAKSVPAPNFESLQSYSAQSAPPVAQRTAPVPTELARLLDPVALSACVAAVESVTPGRATAVDFARYQGRPALVVTVGTTSGLVAVVVGPACGVAGPDRITGTDKD